MQTSCFIYALQHPTTKEVFYIGKTHNIRKRLKKHLSDSRKNKTAVQMRIHELLKNHLKPEVINFEHVEQAVSDEREQYWIARYGAAVANQRNGGGGRIYKI